VRSVPSGGDNLGQHASNDVDDRTSDGIDLRAGGNDDNDSPGGHYLHYGISVSGNDIDGDINDDVRKRCRRDAVYDEYRVFYGVGRSELPPSEWHEDHYLELLQPGRRPH